MKTASHIRRSLALVVDALLLLSITTVAQAVYTANAPEFNVKPTAMQLMTGKEMYVFMSTTSTMIAFIALYILAGPQWLGGTLGHHFARIRLVRLDGGRVLLVDSMRRLVTATVRMMLVFFSGPTLALAGQSIAVSVLALIWSIVVLLPIPVKIDPERTSLWQIMGNYKFVERERTSTNT